MEQSNIFSDGLGEELITIEDNKNNLQYNQRLRVAWKDYGVVLMPGDSIVVRESQRTINVAGDVYNPGYIEFIKGKNIRYYIDSVGVWQTLSR